MIRATRAVATALILGAVTSYGTWFSLGGTYLLGIPVSDADVTALYYRGETLPFGTAAGWPLKIGVGNFALTSVTAVTPSWDIEAGFEVHTAYLQQRGRDRLRRGVDFRRTGRRHEVVPLELLRRRPTQLSERRGRPAFRKRRRDIGPGYV